MLQLKNHSPFKAQIAVFPNEDAIDTLYVAVKGTFALGSRLELAPEQLPPVAADEYWGEPGKSSLKYASEVHLTKPSTDIALVGQAWAPADRKVPKLDVSLAVADRRKVVRVFGDRQWRPGFWFLPARMTSPKPFRSMPLVYERSFGGTHEAGGKKKLVLFEARNPVGRGFVGKRRGRALDKLPLPNLESASKPIKNPKDQPPPAGFGPIAPSWEPRKAFAGTYDDAWNKSRAPYLPRDFDPRFFHAAHPDLVTSTYLTGGEPVEALNVSSEGPLRFRLPRCQLTASIRVAGRTEQPPLHLESVLIEPDENRICLLWRAALPCDKRTLEVEEVGIGLEKMDLDGGAR